MYIAQEADVETSKFIKTIGKYAVAFAMGVWAFGESAGRARAAAELSRQGYHEEARALMLSPREYGKNV
jgi:hypothetical protein